MRKLIASVAALLATGVAAQQASDNPQVSVVPAFDTLDRNADDRLSRSEAGYDRLLSAIFARSDANGDGFVSRAEYAGTIEAIGARGAGDGRRGMVSM